MKKKHTLAKRDTFRDISFLLEDFINNIRKMSLFSPQNFAVEAIPLIAC